MNNTSEYRNKLETQIREAYGRVVYSQTTHEKRIQRIIKCENRIKLWQIILSAASTGGFVGILIADELIIKYTGAFVSFFLLILNSYYKNFNLAESAQSHNTTAQDLWNIREDYISLLTDFSIMTDEKIRDARDELKNRTHEVYKCALKTDRASYEEAQKALKEQEEQTFSDEEIDNILPPALRRHKPVALSRMDASSTTGN